MPDVVVELIEGLKILWEHNSTVGAIDGWVKVRPTKSLSKGDQEILKELRWRYTKTDDQWWKEL